MKEKRRNISEKKHWCIKWVKFVGGQFSVPCEAPHDKAQAAVRIQADGDLARGVEFTLQLHRAAQCTDCCMRHLA